MGSIGGLIGGPVDDILTTPDHTRRTFTSGGQLASVVDKEGKGLNLTHVSGKLASVKDSAGRTTTFTVGADGLLTEVALPDTTSVFYGCTVAGGAAHHRVCAVEAPGLICCCAFLRRRADH